MLYDVSRKRFIARTVFSVLMFSITLYFALFTSDAFAAWMPWKPPSARIEFTPTGPEEAAFHYYHFNWSDEEALKTVSPVYLHKMTLDSIANGEQVYVGHVATSGWLTEVKGVTNDASMHPPWPEVEAGAAYIGDPDKDWGPPVQYAWDTILNVHWHGAGASGGYENQSTEETRWSSANRGWHHFMLSVEDSGNYAKDVWYPWPPYYALAAQMNNLVFLFHVATVSVTDYPPPSTPPEKHAQLHWFNDVPPLIPNFPYKVHLCMFGFRRGHFSFTVTQGQDKVDLISVYDSSIRGNSITYDIDTEGEYVKVIVQSTAPSTSINDITIECKWGESEGNAVKIINYKTTVWSPKMNFLYVIDKPTLISPPGYESEHYYYVIPSLLEQVFVSEPVPLALSYRQLPCNEVLSGPWYDARWTPPGVNGWDHSQRSGSTGVDGVFKDTLSMNSYFGPYPQPVSPVDFTPVMGYAYQVWRAGTGVWAEGGVDMETPKSPTFYLGCARRE